MYKSLKAFRKVGTKVERCKQLIWRVKSTTIAATLLLAAGLMSSCEIKPKRMVKPFIVVVKYRDWSYGGVAKYFYSDSTGYREEFTDGNDKYNIGDTLR